MVIRDVLAVARFTTDVETKATVFFSTNGGTYGTPDEFEIVDQLQIPLEEWYIHYPLKDIARHPPVFLSHISHPHVVDSSRDALLFKQD